MRRAVTCTGWPTRNAGLSLSATLASIHMVEISVTVNGAGALPGCTNRPGAALRAVMRPSIGLGTTSVGSALRCGDDAVDLGFGLAEQPHRIARRAQIALGGLLIGRRLLDSRCDTARVV